MADIKHAQIAVIGSVGKTDVSRLIGVGLRYDAPIYFTDNREQRSTNIEHAIVIHEIDPQSIVYDTEINPDVAVILPYDDSTGTSFDIVEAMVCGGVIIIADCYDYPPSMLKRSKEKNLNIVKVSLDHSEDVCVEHMVLLAECSCVMAQISGESITYKIGQTGRHSVLNSLMALAAIKAVGGDLAMAGLAFATQKARKGHGRKMSLGVDGHTSIFIDYSQGLKQLSLGAALDHMSRIKTDKYNRRIVVMSDSDIQYHDTTVKHMLAAGVTKVLTTGEAIAHLERDARIITEEFQTNDALQLRLQMMVRAGDVVLVMGTQTSGFSELLDALSGHFSDSDDILKIAAE